MREMKIICIIQARMGSTRLPGKVLKKIGGKPILEILINRLKKSSFLDEIVVATTVSNDDTLITEIAQDLGVGWYRGSEEDVLKRYAGASRKYNADVIVRATADNPLTDPVLMDTLIEMQLMNDADYVFCDDAPLGVSTEIFSRNALERTEKESCNPFDREHVTPFIKSKPEKFIIICINSPYNGHNFRLTMDTAEDFILMTKLQEGLGNLEDLQIRNVTTFLEKHPEIRNINASIRQRTVPLKKEYAVKISVIIRTHNSENFIIQALNSVLKQTLSKALYEIVVIDDGSTDKTREILKNFGTEIRCVKGKDLGAVKAINLGIKNSRGQYIILLDSDDYFERNALYEMLSAIEEVNADFVYCNYFEKIIEGGYLNIVDLNDNLFHSVAGGILIKKTLIEEMGGYDENFIFPEYDLLIKLIKNNHNGIHIPQTLFTYVRHKGSLTADNEYVEKGFRQLFDKYGKIDGLRTYSW
jgi:spore coat polysaccharide biosynthesis protein SpsF